MTDGGIYTGVDGISFKKFNVKDGAAVKILKDLGIYTVILSSESDPTNSKILESRSKKIGVDDCFYAIDDKKIRNLKVEGSSRSLVTLKYKVDGQSAWQSGTDVSAPPPPASESKSLPART